MGPDRLLDEATEAWLRSLGGLVAIVISHPHYYTTYAEWSRAFACPVYISVEDEMWLDRLDARAVDRRLIRGGVEDVVPGVKAVKTGGHFDGSLVLAWDEVGLLCVADTLVTVPVSVWQPPRWSFVCLSAEVWVGLFGHSYWDPVLPSVCEDISLTPGICSRRITTSIARRARRLSRSCGASPT